MSEQLLNTSILGLIQGSTEWLPISSSGHLRVAEHFLGLTTTPLFDVVLHVATLTVVVFFFKEEVKNILSSLFHLDFRSEYGKLVPLIVIATIPTGIIGLLYAEFLENSLEGILPIGATFIVGATVVYASKLGKEDTDNITYSTALVLGIVQGFAAFHGLSRSGVTISTALLLGLKRDSAFKFSFLLSIPAILGDLLVEAYKQGGQIATSGIGSIDLFAGMVIAMIVGYVALKLLSKIVATKRFHYFAFYTWALGALLVALSLSGF